MNCSNVIAKIVKRLNPYPSFCVRIIQEDGTEFDVFETQSEEKAQQWLRHYSPWIKQPNGAVLVIVDGMLRRAIDLNNKIASSGDTQGTENYATKSHMRAWANEANYLMIACVGAIDEFKKRPIKKASDDLPFDVEEFQ